MGLIQSCKLWITIEEFYIYLNTPGSGGRMNILQACFSATLPLSISFVIENLELDECTLPVLK
jgi:hypothetical protein